MSDPLESKLRRHLAAVDDAPVRDAAAVAGAAAHASRRLRRRRRSGAVLGAVAVATIGVIVVASASDEEPGAVTSVTAASDGPVDTSAARPAPTVTSPPAPASAWTLIPPDPRGAVISPSVVWTGEVAIVVGGRDLDGTVVRSAAAYDPASESWRLLTSPPDGAALTDAIAAWTGTELVLIGDSATGTSAVAYDPTTDAWRTMPAPVGSVTAEAPWTWTGSELLVWPAGSGGSSAPVGLDPATDTWRELPAPAIEPRWGAASVWTGAEWIVWGGTTGGADLSDGAAYDPTTATWRPIAASPLSARRVRGAWTGEEMVLLAGSTGGDPVTGNGTMALADGAAYDPAADTWRTLTPGPAHPGFVPVFTGEHVVLFAKGSAVVYDVAADAWLDTCCEAGGGVGEHPVWTGSQVLLLGGATADTGGVAFTPPAAPSTTGAAAPDTTAPCDDPDVRIDVEPDWRQYAEYRDWTRDGCLVRIDVLADRPGPEHCGWQSARVIVTGDPLGEPYTGEVDALEYVRDPQDVFDLDLDVAFDADAALPPTAVDTGYRSGAERLWLVPGDDTAIYVVTDDGVERWPRAEPPLCS